VCSCGCACRVFLHVSAWGVCMYVYMHGCMCVRMCVCVCMRMCVCVRVRMRVRMCVLMFQNPRGFMSYKIWKRRWFKLEEYQLQYFEDEFQVPEYFVHITVPHNTELPQIAFQVCVYLCVCVCVCVCH
jgi:hypothetical protein